MPRLLVNQFTSFELNEEELQMARSFNELQKMFMMTLRSRFAHEHLALKFDPLNPVSFAQEEAEIKGKILVLNELIGD